MPICRERNDAEIAMSGRAATDEPLPPATLLGVMQTAIAEGLRERYPPPRQMSHQMFVLTMQMNDRARRERAQTQAATHSGSDPACRKKFQDAAQTR